MSDKIEYNDLFADDAFKKGVEGVESIINAFKRLETELKVVAVNQKEALTGFNVNKSDDIKKLNDELAKTNKILTDLQNANAGVKQGELELAKIRQANAKAIQEEEKAAYKLIGSAKPELLENKEALNEVTKAAITLSQASGLELPEAATQLTQALNSFNAPASDAGKFINVLAASSKLGAKEIPFVAEALSKFGGVAKSAGVSIEDSAAAIEILGAKIPQAESVGTNLRGIFIKLQTEAAKSGREFKGLGGELDLLAPRVNDIGFLTKTFGEQNLLAIQTLIQEKDALEDFSDGITNTNAALEQAAINTDTFEQKQIRLENTFTSLKANIGEYIVNSLDPLISSYEILSGKLSLTDAFLKENAEKRNESLERVIKLSYEEQRIFLAKNQALREQNQLDFDSGKINLNLYESRRKVLRDELDAYVALLDAKKKVNKEPTPPPIGGEKPLTDEEIAARKKAAKEAADDEAKLRKQIEDRNANVLNSINYCICIFTHKIEIS